MDQDKLKETLTKIQLLEKEVQEECNKQQNAERELQSALQKVQDLLIRYASPESILNVCLLMKSHVFLQSKELEKCYMNELRQRKALKEMHDKQRQEIDVMRRQQEEADAALYNSNEQKATLEQRISEIELYVKDNEDELARNKHQLEALQADCDRIQQERDAAIREAAELHEKNRLGVFAPSEALNTKFSLIELQQATQDFNPMFKVGEGGFGSVYKGFLRNTTVAIKLLHPESMQGQSEFHQEVSNHSFCMKTTFSVTRKCDLHWYDNLNAGFCSQHSKASKPCHADWYMPRSFWSSIRVLSKWKP